MVRPRKADNNMSRDSLQDWTYVHKHSAIYNTLQLLTDLEDDKVSYQEEVVDPIHALSFCNLDHEYNQEVISAVVSNIRAGHPHGEWLAPVVIVVFPGDERRVVLGHEYLQVARLRGASEIGVQIVQYADMERCQIDLPAIVPNHLAGDPHCRIVSREYIRRKLLHTGYSENKRKLDIAYTFQMLRLQMMYVASGYNIIQSHKKIELHNDKSNKEQYDRISIPLDYEWPTFKDKFEALANRTIGGNSMIDIKKLLISDPNMDRRKNYRAWENLRDQICFDIRLLSAALGQADDMESAPHFMGERVRPNGLYRSEKEFIEKVALRLPEENRRPITMVGLVRIGMLAQVNAADLWLSVDCVRDELDFACVLGRLSNDQPAVVTPSVAQAALNIIARANAASERKEQDAHDDAALMLMDFWHRSCDVSDFMMTAQSVLTTRQPRVLRFDEK